jgi:membrane protease YdiL (CAAX protease family)
MTPPPPPEPRRIPNLFHLMLFVGITLFSGLICEAVILGLHPHDILNTLQDARLQLFANIVIYIIALAIAIPVFPLVWHRTFADGISFRPRAARIWFAVAGLALGFLSQAASSLLPVPKDAPIEKMFAAPGIIWVVTIFGVLVAPLFEEIVFRGFLLPAIAIIVDYMRLPRPQDPYAAMETLNTWRAGTDFSRPALITSSLITSLLFASIHAPQLGFAWSAVALLVCVSLVLCFVRIRTGSVAASALVHTCYNLSVFITLFIATGGYRHLDKL